MRSVDFTFTEESLTYYLFFFLSPMDDRKIKEGRTGGDHGSERMVRVVMALLLPLSPPLPLLLPWPLLVMNGKRKVQ